MPAPPMVPPLFQEKCPVATPANPLRSWASRVWGAGAEAAVCCRCCTVAAMSGTSWACTLPTFPMAGPSSQVLAVISKIEWGINHCSAAMSLLLRTQAFIECT
eukprot:1158519-Pelagomonas_calceolata.AAC.5